MSIGDFCNTEVVVVGRSTGVLEAARLMRAHHVGDLVVVENVEVRKGPVGIVTDRDLVLEVMAQDVNPEVITVGDVMSQTLHSIHDTADLLDTLELMASEGVRRLPIVNASGELEGILTMDDLLWVMAEQMRGLVNVIGREKKVEENLRH